MCLHERCDIKERIVIGMSNKHVARRKPFLVTAERSGGTKELIFKVCSYFNWVFGLANVCFNDICEVVSVEPYFAESRFRKSVNPDIE
ncbi:MAG: hypothetical protein RL072_566 [Actinomycetota bacterium]|jgi:hypothetical protein